MDDRRRVSESMLRFLVSAMRMCLVLLLGKKGESSVAQASLGQRGREECHRGGGITSILGAEQPGVTFLPKYSNMNDPE